MARTGEYFRLYAKCGDEDWMRGLAGALCVVSCTAVAVNGVLMLRALPSWSCRVNGCVCRDRKWIPRCRCRAERRDQLPSDWLAAELTISCAMCYLYPNRVCCVTYFEIKLIVCKNFPPPAETPYLVARTGNPSMETLFFLRALASDDLRQTTEGQRINGKRAARSTLY